MAKQQSFRETDDDGDLLGTDSFARGHSIQRRDHSASSFQSVAHADKVYLDSDGTSAMLQPYVGPMHANQSGRQHHGQIATAHALHEPASAARIVDSIGGSHELPRLPMSSKRDEHVPNLDIIAAEGVVEKTMARPFQDAKATEAASDDDSQTSLSSGQNGPASSLPRLITDIYPDASGREILLGTDEVAERLSRLKLRPTQKSSRERIRRRGTSSTRSCQEASSATTDWEDETNIGLAAGTGTGTGAAERSTTASRSTPKHRASTYHSRRSKTSMSDGGLMVPQYSPMATRRRGGPAWGNNEHEDQDGKGRRAGAGTPVGAGDGTAKGLFPDTSACWLRSWRHQSEGREGGGGGGGKRGVARTSTGQGMGTGPRRRGPSIATGRDISDSPEKPRGQAATSGRADMAASLVTFSPSPSSSSEATPPGSHAGHQTARSDSSSNSESSRRSPKRIRVHDSQTGRSMSLNRGPYWSHEPEVASRSAPSNRPAACASPASSSSSSSSSTPSSSSSSSSSRAQRASRVRRMGGVGVGRGRQTHWQVYAGSDGGDPWGDDSFGRSMGMGTGTGTSMGRVRVGIRSEELADGLPLHGSTDRASNPWGQPGGGEKEEEVRPRVESEPILRGLPFGPDATTSSIGRGAASVSGTGAGARAAVGRRASSSSTSSLARTSSGDASTSARRRGGRGSLGSKRPREEQEQEQGLVQFLERLESQNC